ncbi:Hypothetical predicted protein [Cloeon dipterum]|uniref:C-type lectin domain-containing protein n=1 Tax=Cloeon dipterum TaxID=197152 RepID=A0A8S1D4Z9_9INSE|nr:Hypothetical predicted protein [Cloeon dipterum]
MLLLNYEFSAPQHLLVERNGKVYYFNNILGTEKQHLNWNDSQKWCWEHGMELASLETKEEHTKILTSAFDEPIWTSGVKRDSNTDIWTGTGAKMIFNQPNVYGAKTGCVMATNRELLVYNCNARHDFVCELESNCHPESDLKNLGMVISSTTIMQPETTRLTTPSSNLSTKLFPHSHVHCGNLNLPPLQLLFERKGKIYYASLLSGNNSKPINWRDANLWCKNHGMELASLETETEQSYLDYKNDDQPFWTSGLRTNYNTLMWNGTGQEILRNIVMLGKGDGCLMAASNTVHVLDCLSEGFFICELETNCVDSGLTEKIFSLTPPKVQLTDLTQKLSSSSTFSTNPVPNFFSYGIQTTMEYSLSQGLSKPSLTFVPPIRQLKTPTLLISRPRTQLLSSSTAPTTQMKAKPNPSLSGTEIQTSISPPTSHERRHGEMEPTAKIPLSIEINKNSSSSWPKDILFFIKISSVILFWIVFIAVSCFLILKKLNGSRSVYHVNVK